MVYLVSEQLCLVGVMGQHGCEMSCTERVSMVAVAHAEHAGWWPALWSLCVGGVASLWYSCLMLSKSGLRVRPCHRSSAAGTLGFGLKRLVLLLSWFCMFTGWAMGVLLCTWMQHAVACTKSRKGCCACCTFISTAALGPLT